MRNGTKVAPESTDLHSIARVEGPENQDSRVVAFSASLNRKEFEE